MLTEEEIDSLARQILEFAIKEVRNWDGDYFHAIGEIDGEPVPTYGATSLAGLGSFVMEFMPLDAIKTIIRSSELSLETFVVVLSNSTTGEKEPRRVAELASAKARMQAIEFTSRWASLHLIAFMGHRLLDCVEEAIRDCGVIGESLLAAALAEAIDSKGMPVTVDAREEIEKAATRVASKKRKQLQDHIEGLPHLITKTRLGAPPKSSTQRQRDRDAYTARIETAYRKLRSEIGQRPTKRSVAGELGEGGLSASGGDSRLNAFNVKLGRNGINYNDLVERIENELQQ
jgi:hypothetical protein